MSNVARQGKKIFVGIVGTVVLVVGLVAIPYPGPGWLIVFAGLGILATEFAWARAVLDYAKGKYDAWEVWLGRQNRAIKVLFWCLTAIIVVVTIWLLNGYGLIDGWLHLHQDWAHSPIPFLR